MKTKWEKKKAQALEQEGMDSSSDSTTYLWCNLSSYSQNAIRL